MAGFGGATGETLDLSDLRYQAGATATLSGNMLTVTNGTTTDTLTNFALATGLDPNTFVFKTVQDATTGGTDVLASANGSNLTQSLTVNEQSAATTLFATPATVTNGDGSNVTATLTLAAAMGTLAGSFTTSGDGTYTIAGTAAAVTAALDAVTFAPTAGFNGSATVGLSLSSGGSAGATGSVTVTVNPVIVGDVPGSTYFVTDNYTSIQPGPNGANETEQTTVSNAVAPGVGTLKLQDGSAAVAAVATPGDHTLIGNQNDDVFVAQNGVDELIGGSGNNLYVIDDYRDAIIQAANGTDDTEYSSVSNAVAPNVRTLHLVEGSGATAAVATSGDHNLIGNDNGDVFVAQNGVDAMFGGSGNDIYNVDNSRDTINESANGGYDTVYSSVDFGLAPNVEELHLVEGSSAKVAIGNAGDNTIYANSNGDVLNGLGGNDTLYSGQGSDIFQFSQANFGQQTIVGFDPAHDSLSFAGFIYSDYSALSGHIIQNGNDAVITYDANDGVILKNTQASSITAKNTSFFGAGTA